ncbi:creatininase family protein [Alphaproteobacteria bacterium KMM 3653]|uniref:Creatininase family protein n=1 Tax=Harenicola maris TaxID=2841044 RepID=A0AAP2CLI9_9RHOB|nr:creatininase family protein [Harenicola maris]
MTVAEFRDRLDASGEKPPVILLPFGSTEEQGPHAPMGDYVLADKLAERVAELSGAIAAPCVPFGYAEFFRAFPGGIQLRAQTFCSVVEDVVGAFLDHDIDRVLILNGHSTNSFLIDQVLRKIRRETGVCVTSIDLWRSIPSALWEDLHKGQSAQARGHGGDPITSLSMHLLPQAMRPDLARPAAPHQAMGLPIAGANGIRFEDMQVNMPLNADEVNPDGMMGGDAGLSSPEIGERIFDHLTGVCARFVAHLQNSNPRDLDVKALSS